MTFLNLSLFNLYLTRFQSAPELVERLHHLKHRNSVLTKYTNRLQEKIARVIEFESVGLDEETNDFIRDVTDSPECCSHIKAQSASHMEKWPIHRRSSCFFFQIEFQTRL